MSTRTRTRLVALLALYIDFIFVNATVGLASFLVGRGMGFLSGEGLAWAAELGVSATMVALGRALGLSAGKPLLRYAAAQAAPDNRTRLWANLLLGTLLVLDGLKQAVRWTRLDVVLPVFGVLETTPLKVALLIALGAFSIAAGCLILAFAPMARRAAAALLALEAISLALSWRVMPQGIALAQVARREAQGLPIRDGEIEFMQAVFPYMALASFAVLAGLLLLCRTRT